MKDKRTLFLFGCIIILLIIFITLVVINGLSIKKLGTKTTVNLPTIIPNEQAPGLQPLSSTAQDVKALYGDPVKVTTVDGYTENDYALRNTWRQNKVFLRNAKVQAVSNEQLTNNSLFTDFIKQNNEQPDGILYDPKGYGGETKWYIFSKNGTAFFADYPSGYTYQVITFAPMTYQNFLQNIAPLFSLSQSEPEETSIDGNNPQPQ